MKFLVNTAASSVKGICNEFDEKIINGTTEERAEAGGEVFFNAICAAFAAEYLSKKKNPNTSVDDMADDIKPLEKTKPDVADGVAFVLGIAACFVAPGVANILLSYGMDMATAAFCYAIGDDEEAQQRVIGMAISGARG